MSRPFIVLAVGICSSAGIASADAQTFYVDGDSYAAPPAYVGPAVPRTYVAPPGYAVPVVPQAVVPVAPPAYAVVPDYAVPTVPDYVAPPPVVTRRFYVDRPRVVRRVIVDQY